MNSDTTQTKNLVTCGLKWKASHPSLYYEVCNSHTCRDTGRLLSSDHQTVRSSKIAIEKIAEVLDVVVGG